MSASAHGEKRVRAPIERVHRRRGTTSSSASLARRAAPPPENGPRYVHPSAIAGAMDHLQSRERLGGVELQVREPPPGLAMAVVLRLVPTDESRLEHERLELPARRLLALDASHLAEEDLDLLPPVAVEVGLHPGAKVAGLPHVEHVVVPAHESIHAGGVGERVREPDLAEMRSSSGPNGFAEVAERQDAEPPTRGRAARPGPPRTPSRPRGLDGSASHGFGSTARGSEGERWGRRATRRDGPVWRCTPEVPRGGDSRVGRGSRSGTRSRIARCAPRRRRPVRTPRRPGGPPRSEAPAARGDRRSRSGGR